MKPIKENVRALVDRVGGIREFSRTRLGIAESTISKHLGAATTMEVRTLCAYAQHLQVSPIELLIPGFHDAPKELREELHDLLKRFKAHRKRSGRVA
jgi:hypothetical protein